MEDIMARKKLTVEQIIEIYSRLKSGLVVGER